MSIIKQSVRGRKLKVSIKGNQVGMPLMPSTKLDSLKYDLQLGEEFIIFLSNIFLPS